MSYVAIKDYSGHDELGDPLTVRAGITHVSESWSTLRYPEIRALFALEGSREAKDALRTAHGTQPARPGSSRVLPAGTTVIDKPVARQPDRVRMTDLAYKRLRDQPYGRGHEVGGTLFGYVEGREVVIRDVCGQPGQDYHGSFYRCRNDHDWADRMEAEHRATTGWQRVGDWHSHELYQGEVAQQSRGDEGYWRAHFRAPAYVGLIISRGGGADTWGWSYPVLSSFLVTDVKNDAGDRRINLAPLEIEPEYVPSWRR